MDGERDVPTDTGAEAEQPSEVLPGRVKNSVVYHDGRGHYYFCERSTPNSRQLRCSRKKNGCLARARMNLEEGSVITLTNNSPMHNHEPDLGRRHSYKLRAVLKNRSQSETTSLRGIYMEEARRNPEGAEKNPFLSMRRCMENARRQLFPPIPESLHEFADTLRTGVWANSYSPNEDQRLWYEELANDEGRIIAIVFAVDAFLRALAENPAERSDIGFDVTFKVVPQRPRGICQLMTVVVYFQDVGFPVFFALMSSKTREAYAAVLESFYRKTSMWEVSTVSSDFENALVSAAVEKYPDASFHGCWFHFCQALWRFVTKNGLVVQCRQNENLKTAVKMLMAVPHLPPERGSANDLVLPASNIADGLEAIKTYVREKNLEVQLAPILNYVQHYWMERVTPQCFSVFNRPRRTNNALESFHGLLLSIMGSNSNIWKFLTHLADLANTYKNEFSAVIQNREIRRQKPLNKNSKVLCHMVDGVFETLQTHTSRISDLDLENQETEDDDTQDNAVERALGIVPQQEVEATGSSQPPNMCKVCLLNTSTHMVYPCGHFALCECCVTGLRNTLRPPQRLKCPLCRSECHDIVRVFY